MADLRKWLQGENAPVKEEQKEKKGFEAIPEGSYTCKITRADIKPSYNDSSVSVLALGFKVLGPKYAGRWVWLNMDLTKERHRQLKDGLYGALNFSGGEKIKDFIDKICTVGVGVFNAKDSDTVDGKKNWIRGIRKSTDEEVLSVKPPSPLPGDPGPANDDDDDLPF
tara:strand:+ start:1018 stop:1518 length:501 start_codon:yes stop_codon:yes gene_type:complete